MVVTEYGVTPAADQTYQYQTILKHCKQVALAGILAAGEVADILNSTIRNLFNQK